MFGEARYGKDLWKDTEALGPVACKDLNHGNEEIAPFLVKPLDGIAAQASILTVAL